MKRDAWYNTAVYVFFGKEERASSANAGHVPDSVE